MPYTFDNIEIAISNNTAVIATDWGTSGAVGLSLAHAQISKIAWGDQNTTYRTNEATPLPVKIFGTTGTTVPISGTVSGTGTFVVGTKDNAALAIKGSTFTTDAPIAITGAIQGMVNGRAVGVTGHVNILNQVSIFGISGGTAITVTGGRRLDSTTDSVTVRGYIGVSGGLALSASTDAVKVYNANGGTAFNVNVYSGNGTAIGASGDALKVAVTNSSFSFTVGVTVGTFTGITNYQGPLVVQGYSGSSGTPLTIKGSLAGGAVEIGAYTAVPVGVSGTVSIDDADIISSIDGLKTNIGTVATSAGYALDIFNLINSTGQGARVNVASITKPSRLVTGLKQITAIPTLLSTESIRIGVTIKSPLRNQTDIYIGTALNMSPANSYLLSPGESIFLEVSSLANIFMRTVAGTADIVYIGS